MVWLILKKKIWWLSEHKQTGETFLYAPTVAIRFISQSDE